MEIGGGVDDDDEEEFYDSEPLPILGRCKSLYPFEGKCFDLNEYFKIIRNYYNPVIQTSLIWLQLQVKGVLEWKRERIFGS